jgi:hypothetical protein
MWLLRLPILINDFVDIVLSSLIRILICILSCILSCFLDCILILVFVLACVITSCFVSGLAFHLFFNRSIIAGAIFIVWSKSHDGCLFDFVDLCCAYSCDSQE